MRPYKTITKKNSLNIISKLTNELSIVQNYVFFVEYICGDNNFYFHFCIRHNFLLFKKFFNG